MMDEKKSKSEIEKKTESKKWRKGGSIKGKPHPKNHVYLGIAQVAIWPPLLRKSGHFVARIFCEKWENSVNNNFDFGNEYFDSD